MKTYRDQGPCDTSLITAFEEKLRIHLPRSYINLLTNHNALIPENKFFKLTKDDSPKSKLDISFYGFGDEIKSLDKIERAVAINIDYLPESVIPFGRSAGGDYICFSFDKNNNQNEPSIVVAFHDEWTDDEKMIQSYIAKDFDSFLNMLEE